MDPPGIVDFNFYSKKLTNRLTIYVCYNISST
uniref:Uncharacterized protein n=1 Tax=viral metagenome TaxID=1070528 RepID=A0A6C0C5F5_9ZZZZ